MNRYLVLFREPNGRMVDRPADQLRQHQQHWKTWMARWSESGHIAGGGGLTVDGRVVHSPESVTSGIHRNGAEIVGGYLLLQAENFDAAAGMIQSCPIFEFGGYAEIRQVQAG